MIHKNVTVVEKMFLNMPRISELLHLELLWSLLMQFVLAKAIVTVLKQTEE